MRFQPRGRRATLADVARLARVSAGTVSRALTGSPLVRGLTRRRVLEAAQQLSYSPNVVARRLATGRTLSIGVVVPFFTRPSAVERLSGVVSALSRTPYDLLIHDIETPERRANCFETLPRQGQVDGILVLSVAPTDEEARLLEAADVPVVLVDADHPGIEALPRVLADDVGGAQKAARHLLALGHRSIGFVGDRLENPFGFHSSADRLAGLRQALEAAGATLLPQHYVEGEHGRAQARELARRLLALPNRPSAVLAASDTQASGVLEAARDLDLRVPADLSVVGYDDIELAEILGLTTVRQSLFRSGQLGVELLLAALCGRAGRPARHMLETELVVRNTSAAAPSSLARPRRTRLSAGLP